MLPIQRILVAVDFSASSEVAAEYAVGLAERFGASVTLLHAYSFPVGVAFPGAPPLYIPGPEVMVESANEVGRQLDELRSRIHRPDVGIAIVGLEGSPKEQILRFADEQGFDLIVVGTHGRTGARRVLLGSVAEAVVRHSHRPVFVVHEPTEETAHTTA